MNISLVVFPSWDSFSDELTKISAAKDYAKGIPKKGVTRLIPMRGKHEASMNVQRHEARRAGTHWDLRFQDPDKPVAYSWAIPKAKWPEKGEKLLAVRQPDHRASYMGYSGVIETGYGEGKVQSEYHGPVQVEEANAGKIRFNHDGGEYLLHRTKSKKNWLIRRTQ